MELNIIKKSDFGSATALARLDAEFVWRSLWESEKALQGRPGWRLHEVTSKYSGPTINDKLYESTQVVTYIDIDSVDTADGLAYADVILYGDRPSRAKYKVRVGDLLVSNVRPNRGAITFVNELRAGSLASSGFTLLRDKKLKEAPQSYIWAFLKSGFGRMQLKRRSRGSMYPAVIADDILDVWIPKPPEPVLKKVHDAFERGITSQVQFFKLVKKQTEMLDNFLSPFGQPPSPLEGKLDAANWTPICKKQVDEAERVDAEFFRREYTEFDAHLESNVSTFNLGQFYHLSTGRGIGKGEETVPFIKQSALTNAGVNWSAVLAEPGAKKSAPNVRMGDILLACTAHEVYYVGRKVDLVRRMPPEIAENNSAVADVMILHPKAQKPEGLHSSFVAAFLRSPAGLHQVQRCIRGLRGGHVYRDDLSKYVRIPIPDQKWLDAFEQTTANYESVRTDAKAAIESAVKMIEDWLSV